MTRLLNKRTSVSLSPFYLVLRSRTYLRSISSIEHPFPYSSCRPPIRRPRCRSLWYASILALLLSLAIQPLHPLTLFKRVRCLDCGLSLALSQVAHSESWPASFRRKPGMYVRIHWSPSPTTYLFITPFAVQPPDPYSWGRLKERITSEMDYP